MNSTVKPNDEPSHAQIIAAKAAMRLNTVETRE